MIRFEVIKEIMEVVTDELIICNLGHPSQELFAIKDCDKNFYMLGSMGLASSIGLGLAMSITKKVIVIEGDGSILMNLGSLATIGANQPKNYILIIIDNESYGSTGFQPTFTAKGVDLKKVAHACNIKKTIFIKEKEEIKDRLKKILNSNDGPYCIIIKAQKGLPSNLSIIPYEPEFIKKRFMENI